MQCKGVIEKEVGKIEGVVSVSADPASKDVVVEFDMPATCANTPVREYHPRHPESSCARATAEKCRPLSRDRDMGSWEAIKSTLVKHEFPPNE